VDTYEKLLNEAIEKLPDSVVKDIRFEIPKVKGQIQGNKTTITNFNQIVQTLRRDMQHFLKYLLKELGAPGNFDGSRLVLGRKISASLINQKIQQYSNLFVICQTCNRPDTQIIKREGFNYLKCAACGSQNPIKL